MRPLRVDDVAGHWTRRYYVELPVFRMRGEMYVRVSAQMYNYEAEYDRLADAVLEVQGIKPVRDA